MSERQQHIDFDRNYCEHYDPKTGGIGQDFCALGCDHSAMMKKAREQGMPRTAPCIAGHTCDATSICPKWERRSLERAEERADAMMKSLLRMELAASVIKKWRTWTKTNKVGKTEVIECPACKGRLLLSQSAYNGHVHGKCETEDCLSWME